MRQLSTIVYIRFGLYALLTLGFIVTLLVHVPELEIIMGLISAAAFLLSFAGAFRTFQIIGVLASSLSIFFVISANVPPADWLKLLNSTGLLLALLFLLPFINDVITAGGYGKALRSFISHRTKHAGHLYQKTGFISYVLCIFLFFASIPTVYKVLKETCDRISAKFASQTILRAFALATVWSPIEIFIAFVASMTHVDYLQLLPWLLLFSVVLTAGDWTRGYLVYRRDSIELNDAPNQKVSQTERNEWLQPVLILFAALLMLIGLNACLHFWFGFSFFEAMTLTLMPFTFVWALIIGQSKSMVQSVKRGLSERTRSMQNFVVLFIALGFFNEAVTLFGMPDSVQEALLTLAENPPILFIVIQILSLILTFIGVHPFVTLGLLGTMITPLLNDISPISLSIVLITSNLAGDAAGTYNTTVTLMNDLTKVNPYRITLWNLGFAFLYGSFGTLIAIALL